MSHTEQDHHAPKGKPHPEMNDLFGISALDVQGDEPCLVQGAKMAGTSFIAGSLFGGVLVYWKDTGVHQRRGRFAALQGTLKTIGSYGGLFALVGATYGTTYCALQHSRTKGDPFNAVMASCAAGGVIGARTSGSVFGSVMGCAVTSALVGMGEFFDWTFSPNTAKLAALQAYRNERLRTSPGAIASHSDVSASDDSDAQ